MHHQKFPSLEPFAGVGGMKRIPSELILEAAAGEGLFDDFVNPSPAVDDYPNLAFKNEEKMKGLADYEGLLGSLSWCQDLNPCVSATIDSQSSVCAGSPTSTLKPKAGDNQGSGSSEEADSEIEARPCKKSKGTVDTRSERRKASNRTSAQRSRRRKQAQLQDLETQVEQLSGENAIIYQQLTVVDQKLKDATTNNRVLKSDVEALRAKVKLAEDMVTRGSLSCSFNQILQTHLSSTQLQNANLSWVTNMFPTLTIQGQDAAFGSAFPGNSNNDNVDLGHILNWNVGNEDVSCGTDVWPGPGVDQ